MYSFKRIMTTLSAFLQQSFKNSRKEVNRILLKNSVNDWKVQILENLGDT